LFSKLCFKMSTKFQNGNLVHSWLST
jgi:hypothetical protein